MNIKCVPESVLLCALVFFSNTVFSNTLEQQRQAFLLAEKLAAQGNQSAFLSVSATLTNYPLYPYLQYLWLKNKLPETDKILGFLSTYKDSRYADLLRADWLSYLANNERWLQFINNYQAGDNIALECRFYWANYKVGNQELALKAAKRLWTVGDRQPEECDSLFSVLAISPVFTTDLIWQRFELALKKDNKSLASYVLRFLNEPDQATADFWLQVHKKPALIEGGLLMGADDLYGRIFAHGVDRLAQADLDSALGLWDSRKRNFVINNQTTQQIERRLALALARARDNRAYDRLNQLITVDAEVREWKVRAALFEQNWPHVAQALAGLTPEEQKTPQWQYWQARSLIETGNVLKGLSVFNQLAQDRSYYGFMAADAINKPYNLTDKPVVIMGDALEKLAQTTDFKAIQ